ncbi:RES family NAD+ phosphorylase [Geobacter sp. DSM 9736]|uniref:RES family NAD+ phosphorylase n=1 Tax=Geobacter sp. DSM 9736 TaxID=1277350 RepID=UPI000B5E8533|nr:RES family NAD+ phosphorylase [Geobacter sp. DSM 9736]SNB44618.1 RES domain-containing protein [Geobacter sp. DSM 9736]
MSSTTWTPDALSSNSRRLTDIVWRMVEAQHVASTMKLVDTLAEQDLLEEILEESKPPVPAEVRDLDYLLAAPFRYVPVPPGSRFRATSDPGVFYAAESVRTASAEVAFWRWRFLQETAGLERLGPAQHTAFSVRLDGKGIDLRASPFDADSARWTDPHDYTATQQFARTARDAGVEAIKYESVRDPSPSWCIAVLTPNAFAAKRPEPDTQTWQLVVTRDEAIWRRGATQTCSFPTSRWSSFGGHEKTGPA